MKIWLITLLLFYFNIFYAQVNFSGVVKDAYSNEKLIGASVYIPETSIGTLTDESGLFFLDIPKDAKFVVISYVGYETIKILIHHTEKEISKTILLKERINQLNTVEIIAQQKSKNKKKYLNLFTENFIGTTPFASKCYIKNPDALIFEMKTIQHGNVLTASANEPLIIINESLGYEIIYELISFEALLLNNKAAYCNYVGNAFYKDNINEKKLNTEKILLNRKDAYLGSSLHFLRSLYNGLVYENNFSLKEFSIEYNDKYKIKEALHSNSLNKLEKATLSRKLHEPPKIILSNTILKENDIVIENDSIKTIKFKNFIQINYTKAPPHARYKAEFGVEDNFQKSQINLTNDSVELYENGNYFNPNHLIFRGYMAWKKIADTLPFDYIYTP